MIIHAHRRITESHVRCQNVVDQKFRWRWEGEGEMHVPVYGGRRAADDWKQELGLAFGLHALQESMGMLGSLIELAVEFGSLQAFKQEACIP